MKIILSSILFTITTLSLFSSPSALDPLLNTYHKNDSFFANIPLSRFKHKPDCKHHPDNKHKHKHKKTTPVLIENKEQLVLIGPMGPEGPMGPPGPPGTPGDNAVRPPLGFSSVYGGSGATSIVCTTQNILHDVDHATSIYEAAQAPNGIVSWSPDHYRFSIHAPGFYLITYGVVPVTNGNIWVRSNLQDPIPGTALDVAATRSMQTISTVYFSLGNSHIGQTEHLELVCFDPSFTLGVPLASFGSFPGQVVFMNIVQLSH